ncbi:MAG: RNA polymerase subunit sigma, partial [Anaerolineae bacterium]|nr:RNA polymerase subunit sigma [Anaerolineae bacterium]
MPALQVGEKRHALFPEAEVVIEDIDHVPVDDTVSVYFRQMAGEPLLTAGQEVMLAKRIERGREAQKRLGEKTSIASEEVEVLEDIIKDAQAAREHLSRANTRLVVSIAKRYRNQGLPLSDLIQEGNVGLMITIDKYDYRLGNRF